MGYGCCVERCNASHHIPFTGKSSAHYSCPFWGAGFLDRCIIHVRDLDLIVWGLRWDLTGCWTLPLSELRPGINPWRGAELKHTAQKGDPSRFWVQMMRQYWTGPSGQHLTVALNPSYWVTFPSTVYLHLEKPHWESFSPSNDFIWIHECQGAVKHCDYSQGTGRVMGNVSSLEDICSMLAPDVHLIQ